MKTLKKTFILLLIFALLIPQASVFAANQRIEITSLEEFLSFAKQCNYDKFSMGKTVVLKTDLELGGSRFQSIPIFCGTFEGDGHKISGLTLTGEQAYQALFRYTSTSTVIRNLSVSGSVKPQGEKTVIGGIVAKNEGLIENCSFSGLVNGTDSIGGIAGVNLTSGTILGCTVYGGVYGETRIGGIVGDNSGTVLRCTNRAKINTVVEEHKFVFQDLTLENVKASDNLTEITDIGGICGTSVGVIRNCTNNSTVGYTHVGYNVGGIVGRQSGYVTGCQNVGDVLGRKEVGGIAGQMEPYSVVLYSPSKLKELQKELDTLQSLSNGLTKNAKGSSDVVSAELEDMITSIDNSRVLADDILNQTEDILNQNIEEVNEISTTFSGAIDRLVDVSDAAKGTSEDITNALTSIEDALHFLTDALKETEGLSKEYQDVENEISNANDSLEVAMNYFKNGSNALAQALELVKNKAPLADVIAQVRSANQSFSNANSNLLDASRSVENAFDELSDLLRMLDKANPLLQKSLTSLADSVKDTKAAVEKCKKTAEKIDDLLNYLNNSPEISFVTTGENYRNSKDALSHSLEVISNCGSQLNSAVTGGVTTFLDDLEAVNNQLFVVLRLLIDITNDISTVNLDISDRMEDISTKDTDGQTAGKVTDCMNAGTIQGDINTGGIAGSMAVEYGFDKEDDLKKLGQDSARSRLQTRAVIRDSKNTGNVLGKKDGVGGIVGAMDLGYVRDCTASGSIESETGSNVGGIAGSSNSLIFSCWSKANVSGKSYVGGLVGDGYELSSCYAMAEIDASGAYVGAVAGNLKEDGSAKNNRFVSADWGGIDGISYLGKADPVSYGQMMQIKGAKEIFKTVTLSFVVEDEVVERTILDYGANISEDIFPEIPPKEGYYGKWKPVNMDGIDSDLKIEAEYIPYRTSLESQTTRENGLPVLLVEGKFQKSAALSVSQVDSGVFIEAWSVSIPEDANTTHTVRFLPPPDQKRTQISLKNGEQWEPVSTKTDGAYLTFETSSRDFTFSVSEKTNPLPFLLIPLALIAIVLALPKILRARKNHQAMKKKAKETEAEALPPQEVSVPIEGSASHESTESTESTDPIEETIP